jgi:hypothetical protein
LTFKYYRLELSLVVDNKQKGKKVKLALIFAIMLFLSVTGASAQSASTTVTITILSGPFTAEMHEIDDLPTLVVDDQTGLGKGWRVQVECTCQMQKMGAIQVVSGSQHPYWEENQLIADPDSGFGGLYYQAFAQNPGIWTITQVSGP